jgi:hypothetical protein
MIEIIIILKLIVICFILSDLANFIGEVIAMYQPQKKVAQIAILFITYILTCPKCFSFWFSLIMTGDLFQSAIIAIMINLLDILNKKRKTQL